MRVKYTNLTQIRIFCDRETNLMKGRGRGEQNRSRVVLDSQRAHNSCFFTHLRAISSFSSAKNERCALRSVLFFPTAKAMNNLGGARGELLHSTSMIYIFSCHCSVQYKLMHRVRCPCDIDDVNTIHLRHAH